MLGQEREPFMNWQTTELISCLDRLALGSPHALFYNPVYRGWGATKSGVSPLSRHFYWQLLEYFCQMLCLLILNDPSLLLLSCLLFLSYAWRINWTVLNRSVLPHIYPELPELGMIQNSNRGGPMSNSDALALLLKVVCGELNQVPLNREIAKPNWTPAVPDCSCWRLIMPQADDVMFPSHLRRHLVFNTGLSSVLSVTSALSQSQCPDISMKTMFLSWLGCLTFPENMCYIWSSWIFPQFMARCDEDTYAGVFMKIPRITPTLHEPVCLSQTEFCSRLVKSTKILKQKRFRHSHDYLNLNITSNLNAVLQLYIKSVNKTR